jgi:ferric-dicitrate binding protein FerR (iron transport regulator)
MNRSAFLELLTRYEAHRCTPEECRLVEQWYELLGEPVEIPFSEEQWIILEQKLWIHINPATSETDTALPVRPLWRKVLLVVSGIAAVLAIVVGISRNQEVIPGIFGEQSLISKVERADWTQYVNETSKSKSVKLSDGSFVVLAPHAQLAVHKAFDQNNRQVRLLGEASFDVHRDPEHPFLVYCGDIITKVLGTTFQIRANDPAQPIQVTVQSGKVTVYRQTEEGNANVNPNSGVILTPNQKATYFPDNKQFVTGITEDPQPIVVDTDQKNPSELIFNDTPIGEVIHKLEIIYGTEIELEQDSLSNCPFTGNLVNQALYTKLELLCGTINGTYEVRGTKILITGKGCQ